MADAGADRRHRNDRLHRLSRSEGRRLFTEWLDSKTVEEIAEYKWIFTHDDEISMGILEALQSSEIDAEKKDAFLAAGVHLASSSGHNEFYSVLKGIHQRDYSAEVAGLADLFTVTYDPRHDRGRHRRYDRAPQW